MTKRIYVERWDEHGKRAKWHDYLADIASAIALARTVAKGEIVRILIPGSVVATADELDQLHALGAERL